MSDYGSTPPPPPPGSGDGGYGGGYAAPPPVGGGMGGPVDHPKGMTVLILGILGIVCCSPLGIVAFFMGNTALKEIDAQPGRYGNRQIVQRLRVDCDQDAVVLEVTVEGHGASCHRGFHSCFYREVPVGSPLTADTRLAFVETDPAFDPDKVYGCGHDHSKG